MISVRPKTRDVVFTASAAVASSPRIQGKIRRLILCPQCGGALEVEVDVDFARLAEKPLELALQAYDADGDFRAVTRSGMTVLSSNRHLSHAAPASRQCSAGILVGTSPQGVYAGAWAGAVGLVTDRGPMADERRRVVRERTQLRKTGAPETPLPDGVESILSQHHLFPQRPPEPAHLLRVLDLPFVRMVAGREQEDGFVYLLQPNSLAETLDSPFAPELLLSLCGGDGLRRTASFSLPQGLVVEGESTEGHLSADHGLGPSIQCDLFA